MDRAAARRVVERVKGRAERVGLTARVLEGEQQDSELRRWRVVAVAAAAVLAAVMIVLVAAAAAAVQGVMATAALRVAVRAAP